MCTPGPAGVVTSPRSRGAQAWVNASASFLPRSLQGLMQEATFVCLIL